MTPIDEDTMSKLSFSYGSASQSATSSVSSRPASAARRLAVSISTGCKVGSRSQRPQPRPLETRRLQRRRPDPATARPASAREMRPKRRACQRSWRRRTRTARIPTHARAAPCRSPSCVLGRSTAHGSVTGLGSAFDLPNHQ